MIPLVANVERVWISVTGRFERCYRFLPFRHASVHRRDTSVPPNQRDSSILRVDLARRSCASTAPCFVRSIHSYDVTFVDSSRSMLSSCDSLQEIPNKSVGTRNSRPVVNERNSRHSFDQRRVSRPTRETEREFPSASAMRRLRELHSARVYELARELMGSAEVGGDFSRRRERWEFHPRANNADRTSKRTGIDCFPSEKSLDLFRSKTLGVALTFAKILTKSPGRRLFEYQRIPARYRIRPIRCSWKEREPAARSTELLDSTTIGRLNQRKIVETRVGNCERADDRRKSVSQVRRLNENGCIAFCCDSV